MTEKQNTKIDQLFKEGLGELHAMPPAGAWDAIAAELDKKPGKRKFILWISVAAVLFAFAGISTMLYYYTGSSSSQSTHALSQHSSTVQDTNQVSASENKQALSNTSTLADTQKSAEKPATVAPLKVQEPSTTDLFAAKATGTKNILNADKGGITKEVTKNTPSSVTFATKEESVLISLASSANNLSEGDIAFHMIQPLNLKQIPNKAIPVNLEPAKSVAPVTEPLLNYQEVLALTEPEEITTPKNRWAISGQMAPLYSYRNVSKIDMQGISKSALNQAEKAITSYASGICVNYETSSRLTFQTGVSYIKLGYELQNVSSAYIGSISTSFKSGAVTNLATEAYYSTGKITMFDNVSDNTMRVSPSMWLSAGNGAFANRPASSESKYYINQYFEFIELPFLAKYKLIDRKVGLHLLGGFSTNFLVNSVAQLKSDNFTEQGTTTGIKKFNYSSSVGFGILYKLSSRISMNIDPTFKYYLNSFNSDGPIKSHPYALGLYSGITYKF